MRPANPVRQGELLASIESTLAEIEKSDIPELNAGPRAFHEWIKQPDAIEVSMGWMKTTIHDELIFTQHLADCSAIVLCTEYDENTGIYARRSLMHAVGSNLSVCDGSEDILSLIQMASESSGKPRCIIALGTNVESHHFATIANQEVQTSEGRLLKPFKELQVLCDTVILERKNSIAVRSDGTYAVVGSHHHG